MTHPFDAPPEVDVPEPVLDAEQEIALGFVHGTLAPKVLVALSLGVSCGASLVDVAWEALVVEEISPSTALMRGIMYCAGLLLAAVSGSAGISGFLASPHRPDRIARALSEEVLLWQVASAVTVIAWIVVCGGGFAAIVAG